MTKNVACVILPYWRCRCKQSWIAVTGDNLDLAAALGILVGAPRLPGFTLGPTDWPFSSDNELVYFYALFNSLAYWSHSSAPWRWSDPSGGANQNRAGLKVRGLNKHAWNCRRNTCTDTFIGRARSSSPSLWRSAPVWFMMRCVAKGMNDTVSIGQTTVTNPLEGSSLQKKSDWLNVWCAKIENFQSHFLKKTSKLVALNPASPLETDQCSWPDGTDGCTIPGFRFLHSTASGQVTNSITQHTPKSIYAEVTKIPGQIPQTLVTFGQQEAENDLSTIWSQTFTDWLQVNGERSIHPSIHLLKNADLFLFQKTSVRISHLVCGSLNLQRYNVAVNQSTSWSGTVA